MLEAPVKPAMNISWGAKTCSQNKARENTMDPKTYRVVWVAVSLMSASFAHATPFFSTGNPDGRIGMASRPASTGMFEIEAADDFILSQQTKITNATFTGLLTGGATASDIGAVSVEIYRVFPKDSNNPPSGHVPTRVNSPSDVAFDSRAGGGLSFSSSMLNSSFTTLNSVQPGGIHPAPNQTTGGNGPITGAEVEFDISFVTPFDLPADHYFFVPQVQLTNGDFYWLSAPRPIVPPGTPFAPDLQTWTRDANLDPDWLRVGTDIVGGSPAPTYNAAFSLSGQPSSSGSVPEPGSLTLTAIGSFALFVERRWRPAKQPSC